MMESMPLAGQATYLETLTCQLHEAITAEDWHTAYQTLLQRGNWISERLNEVSRGESTLTAADVTLSSELLSTEAALMTRLSQQMQVIQGKMRQVRQAHQQASQYKTVPSPSKFSRTFA